MVVRDLLRTIKADCELVFFENKKIILNLIIHSSRKLNEDIFSVLFLFKRVERIENINSNKMFIILESEVE